MFRVFRKFGNSEHIKRRRGTSSDSRRNYKENPASGVMRLQRSFGNQIVQRLIQSGHIMANLMIGRQNDPSEREADKVADRVVQMPEPDVQRQAEPEREEEVLQPQPISNGMKPIVQKQDLDEDEEVQKQAEPEEEEQIQGQEAEEEEELIQSKGVGGSRRRNTSDFADRLKFLKSGGKPLPDKVQASFENRFGNDFSEVRIHTGTEASDLARSINAKAFTSGKDIVFGSGQYSTESNQGKKLLAHELTHVVQQQQFYPQLQRQNDQEKESTESWTRLVAAAKNALKTGQKDVAERHYKKAVFQIAQSVTFPQGINPLKPKVEDIQIDFDLDDFAETRSTEIPQNPNNFWRWIFFGKRSLIKTRAFTQSVIIHELVHVRQYQKMWTAYRTKPPQTRGSWTDFIKPFSLKERVLGPEELEAEVSGLEFLPRFSRKERDAFLEGLFVAYVRTDMYSPKQGETHAITSASARQMILSAYPKLNETIKLRMGYYLWRALIRDDPDKSIWLRVLKDLKPIANKGYSDPTFRPHYNSFLSLKGIKWPP